MSEMWQDLAVAFSLMLVIEGIIPFLYPNRWKNMVRALSQIDTLTMRIIGLVSMVVGVGLLYWVR
ncbi:MAG: DUF2065 domain-containing protein [Pseudomonadales bacterium]|uniref:DUF2065 domain-containing protein n=1 Tax=Oleiphilus messinensis TaxID=141451 RepID=A0A1Y0I667_9GAMM|nr:DUF2065 domain-containing protein [Oleiphilus messinensis]ARU55911.1 hypothetical protein OLMES_1837 [Oleiphilus messinensis]MCG8611607.1 DUF2065 domain-containing protein [Pseudomonadales bacterium]